MKHIKHKTELFQFTLSCYSQLYITNTKNNKTTMLFNINQTVNFTVKFIHFYLNTPTKIISINRLSYPWYRLIRNPVFKIITEIFEYVHNFVPNKFKYRFVL